MINLEDFKTYFRKGKVKALEITEKNLKEIENMKPVISNAVLYDGFAKVGDFLVVDCDNESDKWVISKDYFHKYYTNKSDEIRDEYHTMEELYDYRMAYNAMFVNAMYELEKMNEKHLGQEPCFKPSKSWKHSDGEWCFGKEKEWFIVTFKTPYGIVSNHYKAEYFYLFDIPETEKSAFEYDGHTPADALEKMLKYTSMRNMEEVKK